NANRTHRRLVAQAKADGVAEVAEEMFKSDAAIDVAAVIKHRPSQALVNGQRESPLGVENKKLVSAGRSGDVGRARGKVVHLGTKRGHLLRPGAVQGEASQALRSAR